MAFKNGVKIIQTAGYNGARTVINYLPLTIVPMPPWCNETAYPVETVTWKGTEYSRLDAATDLFHRVSQDLQITNYVALKRHKIM